MTGPVRILCLLFFRRKTLRPQSVSPESPAWFSLPSTPKTIRVSVQEGRLGVPGSECDRKIKIPSPYIHRFRCWAFNSQQVRCRVQKP